MKRVKEVTDFSPWSIFIILLFLIQFGLIPEIVSAENVASDPPFEIGDGIIPPIPGSADILGSELPGPDWGDLFNADGTRNDNFNGDQLSVFISDDVSSGISIDETALAGSDMLVDNAIVDPDQDIGNVYANLGFDSSGNLVLFGGAERLDYGDGYLTFELNQGHIRIGHGGYGRGEPWQIDGKRAAGDVRVYLDFSNGSLIYMEVQEWVPNVITGSGTFQTVQSLNGEMCNADGTVCVVSNAGDIFAGPWSNIDPNGDPAIISAQRFLEFSVNVGALIGTNPDFTSILFRTSQDIAFGYFKEGN